MDVIDTGVAYWLAGELFLRLTTPGRNSPSGSPVRRLLRWAGRRSDLTLSTLRASPRAHHLTSGTRAGREQESVRRSVGHETTVSRKAHDLKWKAYFNMRPS